MTISIILLLLMIVVLSENNSTFPLNNGFIYRGDTFKSKDYPYIMYLRFWSVPKTKGYGSCTGSLVKKLFILTAGHCCNGHTVDDIEVCQGSPLVKKPDFHNVAKIYLHEKYSPIKNDICVLKLEKAFPNITTFLKIGGSAKDFKNDNILNCRIFGFGLTGDIGRDGDTGYMMTNAIVHGKRACKNHDGKMVKENWKQYLCLVPNQYASPCQGDSGGPLICNDLQYGLCSFMYPYIGNDTGCGSPNQQVVYMFVNSHGKWLKNIIESKTKKNKRSSENLTKPLLPLISVALSSTLILSAVRHVVIQTSIWVDNNHVVGTLWWSDIALNVVQLCGSRRPTISKKQEQHLVRGLHYRMGSIPSNQQLFFHFSLALHVIYKRCNSPLDVIKSSKAAIADPMPEAPDLKPLF
ncbi:hypothetical protein QTP88_020682 [Uroleucon formosanum]